MSILNECNRSRHRAMGRSSRTRRRHQDRLFDAQSPRWYDSNPVGFRDPRLDRPSGTGVLRPVPSLRSGETSRAGRRRGSSERAALGMETDRDLLAIDMGPSSSVGRRCGCKDAWHAVSRQSSVHLAEMTEERGKRILCAAKP